jgi:hypothetical protein
MSTESAGSTGKWESFKKRRANKPVEIWRSDILKQKELKEPVHFNIH